MKKLILVITCLAFTNVFLGQILSVSPNKGVVGQQLSVTITGNISFYQASTVENVSFSNQFSNFLTVNEVVLVGDYNSDNIKVSLTIPDDANPGDYNVNIFNKDTGLSETLVNGFKVLGSIITTYTSTYEDFNADGFTNVGDVVNILYSLKNNTSLPISDINMSSPNSNLTIYGEPISILNSGLSNNSVFTGRYVITQADINQGFVSLNVIVSGIQEDIAFGNKVNLGNIPLSLSDGIKLNAFLDTNSNTIQDIGESNFTSGSFTTQLNSETIHAINSSSGTHYIYETNPLNSYQLGYTIPASYASKYTVSTTNYNAVSVANGSGITTYNFPVKEIPFNDLAVNLYSWGAPPRPGFEYRNYIFYTNNGNQTIASGTITFNKDNAISITSISQSGTTATTTGFSYIFSNLLPHESRYFYVTMQVPIIPIVVLGQLVTNSASITIPAGDINVANNESILSRVIVGSYDPNEKSESHGGKIQHSTFTNNDYLTYNIQFENKGTAEAINVRVTDVLEDKLDETSIEMITTSEPNYIFERVGKNLTWRFNGINLPPSSASSKTIGHGNIVFKIKPKPGYAIGDIVTNTASIYFDFNPQITTEPCVTEFTANLNTSNFTEFKSLKVYPNPAKDVLTIENNATIDSVEITSILGQKMIKKRINSFQTEINLNQLSNGVYFVTIISNGNEKVVKFIKQ